MNQMTLFDVTERQLHHTELPDHIGERLHYRRTRDEVMHEDMVVDAYVILEKAEKLSYGWIDVVIRYEPGGARERYICNPNTPFKSYWYCEVTK